MKVYGNTVATPGGSLLACGTFLSDWVAAGHDPGTKSVQWPSDEALVSQGKQTLYSDAAWNGGVPHKCPFIHPNGLSRRLVRLTGSIYCDHYKGSFE